MRALLLVLAFLTWSHAAEQTPPERVIEQCRVINEAARAKAKDAALAFLRTIDTTKAPVPALPADPRKSDLDAHQHALWVNSTLAKVRETIDTDQENAVAFLSELSKPNIWELIADRAKAVPNR